MQRKFVPLFFFLIMGMLPILGQAQEKFTLSGYVKEASSGESMIGATVVVPQTGQGVYTNEYGFYSLTLPAGSYDVEFRYVSFETFFKKIDLSKDLSLNVELLEESVQGEVVEIVAEAKDKNISSTEMSVVSVDIKRIKKMPALFGEVDIIKSIQLLPGVSSVGEGLSGYYVRGGNQDQNLILLDEATVYNASHVLGFFSVFNADAISEAKIYKGGIPARFGGRLASVLDIRMNEGNMKSYHVKGGIGVLLSRLTIEGPIQKDKSSFIVSGRRSYADLFLAFAKDDDLKQSKAFFYDLNAKVNYKFSDKDRIYLSGYFGRDVFGFRDVFGNEWGNATGTLRWNHLFSNKLFANTTFVFSDFNYGFDVAFDANTSFKYNAGIRDYSLKSDYTLSLNPENKIRFGAIATLHQFNPGQFIPVGDAPFNDVKLDPDFAVESGFYLSNEQKLSSRVSLHYGMRYSMFDHIGPGQEFTYDENRENILDSTNYKTGQLIKHYGGLAGLEPRISARFMLDANSSLKVSYNRMRQYLHLASNAAASFPWDIWIPSSVHIPPQLADQVAIGYFRNFFNNELETSVELYYKDMRNQIDFVEAADLLLNPTIETELRAGRGWSYGAEFMIQKKYGKLTGILGYTLSYSYRKIDGINGGETYFSKNDRRHDLSVQALYEVHKRVDLSANFVYYTGNATTFPSHKMFINDTWVPVYPARNANRMPDYHRLDLSATFKVNKDLNKRFQNTLNISLYNAYGRKNAWALNFEEEDTDDPNVKELVATKLFLFRWVPSLTWNFEF